MTIHSSPQDYKDFMGDEEWDEEDLWLMERERRRTRRSADLG
jgi:hypothetical protein